MKLNAIWGIKAEVIEFLGKSTAYIERSNLTARIFNARLAHKILAFFRKMPKRTWTLSLGKMLIATLFVFTKAYWSELRIFLLVNG